MDTRTLQLDHAGALTMDSVALRRLADEFHLDVARNGGQLRMLLRPGRQKALASATLILGAILLWSGQFVPELGASTSAVRFAASGFGIALLLLCVYLPFNSVDLEISRRKIRRIRRWCGLAISVRELQTEAVHELVIDRGIFSSGRGNYTLMGVGPFGCIRLIEHVPDPTLLELLHRQITLAAGLRPSGTH